MIGAGGPSGVVVLLGLTVVLAGCGAPDDAALEAYVAAINARVPEPLEPVPEVVQVKDFVYDPGGRRDPFERDEHTAQAAVPPQPEGVAPDPSRRREALERFALEALRMVGTLELNDTRWGLIVTPEGLLHRVRVGNYLGQNNGQIMRITPAAISLTEIVGEGSDGWRERQASLSLGEP
ncbi:pilus assembly protein PilP [uncultured Thiohalocapsa sp.]|uniref:pilus assembly protein PilP n=1 Tax=uncultured Thiohalocapsa sp. TaxID=768990 RepID=UPI0025D3ED80|nr:pilus assembly protein PilP [uncultured Thiohalocapsa sp.]